MKIRERIADIIDGGRSKRVAALQESLGILQNTLADSANWTQSPADVMRNLKESGIDETIIFDMALRFGWDQLVWFGQPTGTDLERQRTLAVQQAEVLYKYSPLAQWSIWLWTGWGLGDKVTVNLDAEDAQAWWDEFALAGRNASILGSDVMHEMSDWTLAKGNRFFAFFASTMDGKATIRTLPQEEIKPISNPEDSLDEWFYKRSFQVGSSTETIYYPDWQTFFGPLEDRWQLLIDKKVVPPDAKRADVIRNGNGELGEQDAPGTAVCVLHIKHNRKNERSPWGWPILTASASWMRAHKQFSEARLGVALSKAQYVRRSTVVGGSRAVRSVISSIASNLSQNNLLDTNPSATPGATWVQNKAMNTEELPMTTGASDAKEDNTLFSWVALLGAGLFPTSAGLDTARFATALEMDKSQSMVFEKYRNFWGAQFRRMVQVVLLFGNEYGGQAFTEEDMAAEVSTDAFSLSDFPDMTEAIARWSNSLTPMVDNGALKADTVRSIQQALVLVQLQSLGVPNAADLTSDEAFGIGEEEEEPPEAEPEDADEPTDEEPTDDEDPEDEPDEEEEENAVIAAVMTVAQNYREGRIDADAVVEFALAEVAEASR